MSGAITACQPWRRRGARKNEAWVRDRTRRRRRRWRRWWLRRSRTPTSLELGLEHQLGALEALLSDRDDVAVRQLIMLRDVRPHVQRPALCVVVLGTYVRGAHRTDDGAHRLQTH